MKKIRINVMNFLSRVTTSDEDTDLEDTLSWVRRVLS